MLGVSKIEFKSRLKQYGFQGVLFKRSQVQEPGRDQLVACSKEQCTWEKRILVITY